MKEYKDKIIQGLKFIDLFCGIGGFRVALEGLGYECVFSSDIDKNAKEAYKDNFGDLPAGDITKIAADNIPAHDILCGGFPCQPFSIAGNRKGVNVSDGNLFREIIRIADYHKPSIMLLENVKNILSIDGGRTMTQIRQGLDSLGYVVYFDMINASLHGLPQSRERVYFICIRKDVDLSYSLVEPTYENVYLRDMLIDSKDCEQLIIDRDDVVFNNRVVVDSLKPIRVGNVNKGCQGARIYSVNGHAITISFTQGGCGGYTGLYLVDGKVRRLHIEECKKIMGFPVSHKVGVGCAGYKQLGNAVMPPIIKKVFSGIG